MRRPCSECGVHPGRGAGLCRGCSTRKSWRDGKFAHIAEKRGDRWLPEEDDLLRHMAGRFDARAITLEFARIGRVRSEAAIKRHAGQLGVSLWWNDWTLNEVARLFCASYRTIRSAWIDTGLLAAQRRPGRGRAADGEWRIREVDIETLIRTCPWVYDSAKLQPQSHRLARLAREIQLRDPWLRVADVARALGVTPGCVVRLCEKGVIPSQRRRVNVQGGGPPGAFVVRACEMVGLQEALAERRVRARDVISRNLTQWTRASRTQQAAA